jgi:hypothetical protein
VDLPIHHAIISDMDAITKAITEAETRLARLDEERLALMRHIQQLHEQLRTTNLPINQSESNTSLTPAEKITLFRSLFCGREDVFPKLWTNRSGGKGYAPACANDLLSGRCGKGRKPRMSCSECGFQSYIPMSDQVIRDHLQGKHVIGVYSLLPDDTCWFLAADFDESNWQEDIAAFRDTCQLLDIPVAIERSRPGNGAHAWFFYRTGAGRDCTYHGVLSHHGNHVPTSSTQHGFVWFPRSASPFYVSSLA